METCPVCKLEANHKLIYEKVQLLMNSITLIYECKCGNKWLVLTKKQLELFPKKP